MSERIRFGVVLPTRGLLVRKEPHLYPHVFEVADRAEALGYDSVWVGDSLISKPRLEVFTTLAYVAGRTERVGLGTSVLLPTLREPVHLAYAAASLDLISGGRLTLGVGVGGTDAATDHEYRTVGADPSRRVGRLEETMIVLRRLWTEAGVTFQGKHLSIEDVTVEPRPAQRNGPRLLLSIGNTADPTPRQVRRVVELGDGIMPSLASPTVYRQTWQAVLAEADRRGRDRADLVPALYWTVHLDDDAAHAAQEADDFLVGYYGRRFWGPDRWGPWGPASVLRDHLDRMIDAGARLIVVRFAAWDALRQLDLFTDRVFSHYQSSASGIG